MPIFQNIFLKKCVITGFVIASLEISDFFWNILNLFAKIINSNIKKHFFKKKCAITDFVIANLEILEFFGKICKFSKIRLLTGVLLRLFQKFSVQQFSRAFGRSLWVLD